MIQIDWILQICSSGATFSIDVLRLLLSCHVTIQGQKSAWEKMPFKVATFCYSSRHDQCSHGLIYVLIPSSKFSLFQYCCIALYIYGLLLLLLHYFHLYHIFWYSALFVAEGNRRCYVLFVKRSPWWESEECPLSHALSFNTLLLKLTLQSTYALFGLHS